MRFVFVMDPAEKMLVAKDTSFALMRGAGARGHECLHCLPRQVSHRGANVFARARSIAVSDTAPHVTLGQQQTVELVSLDAVFIRQDPPFDLEYLHLTQQLDLVKDRTFVLNDPRGLRDANEKLFAFHFSQYMPRSLVSADRTLIAEFVAEVGGQAVLKPLDGAGGSGVVALSVTDRNTRALIELLTADGTRPALVQEYLPAIRSGDKRVLMLDGEPLGVILRVPQPDDLRANIHVGGRVEPTTLSSDELQMLREVGRGLREHGLWFAGLDLIGGKLIEVNVTSPTGIQELGRLTATQPEQDVIAWVLRMVSVRRPG
jgi:glutathione synthase